MTHYGYNEFTPAWNPEKEQELAEKLRDMLVESGFKNKQIQGEMIREREDYKQPYIEVYHGVKIRKITYLDETQQTELIKKADRIYLEVMNS